MVDLYLGCRTCTLQGITETHIHVGLVHEGPAMVVECDLHGPVGEFALDGSFVPMAERLLAQGCESCQKGKPH